MPVAKVSTPPPPPLTLRHRHPLSQHQHQHQHHASNRKIYSSNGKLTNKSANAWPGYPGYFAKSITGMAWRPSAWAMVSKACSKDSSKRSCVELKPKTHELQSAKTGPPTKSTDRTWSCISREYRCHQCPQVMIKHSWLLDLLEAHNLHYPLVAAAGPRWGVGDRLRTDFVGGGVVCGGVHDRLTPAKEEMAVFFL